MLAPRLLTIFVNRPPASCLWAEGVAAPLQLLCVHSRSSLTRPGVPLIDMRNNPLVVVLRNTLVVVFDSEGQRSCNNRRGCKASTRPQPNRKDEDSTDDEDGNI